MSGRVDVTCRLMSTQLHLVTVSLMLLLLLLLVTSAHGRHGDRHSELSSVDIESSDDELAQRDQPMVSHSVNDITAPPPAAAAAC